MFRESGPGRFRAQGISGIRGQSRGIGYFNMRSSSSSYKQEVKFLTILRKQVYNYTEVKDIIFQRVKNSMNMRLQVHEGI